VIGKRPGGGRLNGGRLEVKFRTPQQEHEFGRPYQLGHFPHANVPEVSGRARARGGAAGPCARCHRHPRRPPPPRESTSPLTVP
jgi:hypothetical protein